MSELGHQKVIQYLFEAHAAELTMAHTLVAHIAITPAGRYRDGLEAHFEETKDHARRIQRHLVRNEGARTLLQAGYGLAQGVVGQVVALGKLPVDMVRGGSGEEKLLKNAKDECASEALEIATYTAIEQLALELGDTATAKLAASIRADEERMLEMLLAEIPNLVKQVVQAEVDGDMQYDVRRIGAVDAVRSVAGTVAGSLGRSSRTTKGRNASKQRNVKPTATKAKRGARATAKSTTSRSTPTRSPKRSAGSTKRTTAKRTTATKRGATRRGTTTS